MPRPCVCCNLQEVRLALDEKIRAGIAYAELAREYATYNLSADCLERHGRAHVLRVVGKDEPLDAARVFHEIATRAGEIARSATSLGDLRGAVDALGKQAAAAESYQRIQESREQKSKPAQSEAYTMEDFDRLIKTVTEQTYPNLDFQKQCPLCSQFGAPKGFGENPENHG